MTENAPSDDLMQRWLSRQQELLNSWTESLRGFAGSQGSKIWSETFSAWQRSVTETLDAQARWLENWTESLTASDATPDQLRERIRAGQEYFRQWTEAQKQLWESWFEVMKGLQSDGEAGGLAEAGQRMARTWQDSTSKLIDFQADSLRRWMSPGKGSSSEK